jgi:two-component sensor histidine kinase
MQIAGTNDPRIEDILITLKNRIFSMSRVHDRLYGSTNVSNIDMDDYLRDLVNEIVGAFQRPGLALETDIAASGTAFTVDRATTIGLIISELVSNSMKHAFHGLERGRIEVLLRKEGSRFELCISDDGIGLGSEAFARINEGGCIGFLLIDAFVLQLHGELRRETAKGLRNVITFD